ncbi:MAG: hypothetical protein CVU61_09160 [Deltaproteobacteria bacterium HGW-Deltaproteobacteria-19]|nr:MAG: hypothetical protein CVU61_09160 [Deltaproteobacteria bacterium HGW-Deltaproteobacteria-19]
MKWLTDRSGDCQGKLPAVLASLESVRFRSLSPALRRHAPGILRPETTRCQWGADMLGFSRVREIAGMQIDLAVAGDIHS